MNPWINYHHLYYFKIVAEEGSVSRAAEKLRLGQPTLSAQIKQFEDTLGIKLFERKLKRLILTDQGRVALDYAKGIFKMGSEMYEVLHDRLRPMRMQLHIGALDSIPKQVTMQLVSDAMKIMPCQVRLSEGKSDELIRELAAHRIDLVLTNFLPMGADAQGIHAKLLAKKNVAFYGAPSFKKLKKDFPQSISGQPLVLPTYDSKLRFDLDHWAKLQKIELNVIVESQDVAVKKLMAAQGMGLIAAASYTVSRQIKQGELVEIGNLKGVYEELYLLSTSRRVPHPIVDGLLARFKI